MYTITLPSPSLRPQSTIISPGSYGGCYRLPGASILPVVIKMSHQSLNYLPGNMLADFFTVLLHALKTLKYSFIIH